MTPQDSSPSNLRDWPQAIDLRLRAFFAQPATVFAALLIVVLAAHGYEIFSLHLTIDEEIHIGAKSVAGEWASQGRWGMAWLSLLLPSSVVPVVSTALGIGLLCASLWIVLVRVFDIDRLAAVVALSVALTLPTLPFTLSFTTLSYGFGFASAACVGFIVSTRSRRQFALLVGILVGAFAISVYQPMIFALAALVAVEMFRPGVPSAFKERLRAPLALLLSVGAYFAIDQFVRRSMSTEMQYVEQFVDIGGLLADPVARLGKAASNVQRLSRITAGVFSLHTHWSAAFLTAALLLSFKPNSARGAAKFAPALTSVALVSLPIAAESLSAHGVPLRSGVYLPFVVSLMALVAFANTQALGRLLLTVLATLAVIGNAVVDNRLYAAGAFAYERDRAFAHDLLREIERVAGDSMSRPIRIEVVGKKMWPESPLIPKRETLGASFFEWDEGNRYRVAAFLGLFGTDVRGASAEEIVPIAPIALQMPSWPAEGSIRRERDVVIVKLGDYSPPQKRALCAAGAQELCP